MAILYLHELNILCGPAWDACMTIQDGVHAAKEAVYSFDSAICMTEKIKPKKISLDFTITLVWSK